MSQQQTSTSVQAESPYNRFNILSFLFLLSLVVAIVLAFVFGGVGVGLGISVSSLGTLIVVRSIVNNVPVAAGVGAMVFAIGLAIVAVVLH